ncbi:MAG TPA: 4Fe-4S binding protein [Chloroflexia bacterium]|nr:4Fe-4S binding protein [Chloroflexia bacterium]
MENLTRLIIQILKAGRATRSYPTTPDPAPPGFRGQPVIAAARCTADGACATVCPSGAIQLTPAPEGQRWAIDYARCIFCGRCAEVCPAAAITITREFELASRTRADLEGVVYLRTPAPAEDRP